MTVPLWPSEKWKGAVALDGFETDGSIIELIARGKTVMKSIFDAPELFLFTQIFKQFCEKDLFGVWRCAQR